MLGPKSLGRKGMSVREKRREGGDEGTGPGGRRPVRRGRVGSSKSLASQPPSAFPPGESLSSCSRFAEDEHICSEIA